MRQIMNEKNLDFQYVSPIVCEIDIKLEGILCTSGQNEEWYEETLD